MTASWRPTWARLALGVTTLVLAAGGAWVTSRVFIPGTRFVALSLSSVVSDAARGPQTVGAVFDPDYAWIDRLRRGVSIALDVRSVHQFAPLAGRRFQNRLVVLPQRTNLRAFVASHDIAYVATLPKSFYDLQARRDPAIFKPLGGCYIHTYRVEMRGPQPRPVARAGTREVNDLPGFVCDLPAGA
jgi:hypothetical protein